MSISSNTGAVTVVIPAHNAAATIGRALQSIAKQTASEAVSQVVVVNDASTDGTTAEASVDYGLPVTVVQGNGRGAGRARNRGVDTAATKFVAFLDADDIWYPEKLELQLADLSEAHSFSGVFMHYLTPTARVLGTNVRYKSASEATEELRLAKAMPFALSGILVSRAKFIASGGFDPTFRRAQDFEWAVRMAQLGPCALPTRIPMLGYIIDAGSATADSYVEQALAADLVRQRLRGLTTVGYEEYLTAGKVSLGVRRRALAGGLYRRAAIAVGARRWAEAGRSLAASMIIAPDEGLKKLRWQAALRRHATPDYVDELMRTDG